MCKIFYQKKNKKSTHGRLGELRPRGRRSGSVYSNVSIVPIPRHYPKGVFLQKKFSEPSSEKGGGGEGATTLSTEVGGGSTVVTTGTRLRLTSECTLLEKKERKKQISFI